MGKCHISTLLIHLLVQKQLIQRYVVTPKYHSSSGYDICHLSSLRDEKYGSLPDIFQTLKNPNTSILFILIELSVSRLIVNKALLI